MNNRPTFIATLLLCLASILPVSARAGTDLCADRDFANVHTLSFKKNYKSQYRALLTSLSQHPAISLSSTGVVNAFSECVAHYQSLHPAEQNHFSVHNSDAGITIAWQGKTSVVNADNLKHLPSSLHSTAKALRLGGIAQELYWYLWVESAMAATHNRFNFYVYADTIETVQHQSGGRSFGVGFRPIFEQEEMIADVVRDEQLVSAGLVAGAKIEKITSYQVATSGKFSWWLQQAPFEYAVTFFRDGVRHTVEAKSIPFIAKEFYGTFFKNLAYIRFSSFNARSALELSRFLRKFGPEIKGIIIDVRFNGGGVLNPGVPDFFLKPTQTLMVSKHLNEEKVTLSGSVAYFDLPIVVLQNRYSASMSEILTAALKSQGRATVVGETSFGKGVGQSLYPVKKEGMVAVVETAYFYPDGETSWNETGIEPDVVVATTADEKTKIAAELFSETPDVENLIRFDRALARAREILGAY